MKLCLALLFGFSFFIVVGCDSPPGVSQSSDSIENEAPAVVSTKPSDVRLEIVDGDGYQAALKKHQGKVVLVDFWATWCDPCTENFPHIVELHRKHNADGLRVMSFSCNDLSEENAVRQFLAENGATFDNLLTKFGNGSQTNDTFDLYGVPQYKLYDRSGQLRYQFAGQFDDLERGEPLEKIDERVRELLAEMSPQ